MAIIGGGFSGLSAALMLGRYLRKTVIYDNGRTRNSTSKHVHGYLGFENSSPQEFIQKAWKDVLQYNSIKVVKEKVTEVERITDNNGTRLFHTKYGFRKIHIQSKIHNYSTGYRIQNLISKTLNYLMEMVHGIVLIAMDFKQPTKN